MQIFAIEDEQLPLDTLKRTLLQAEPEAEVQTFLRAADALAALQRGPHPDVIFSDIEMPGMTGLDLALRIRAAAPETKLIFVTGYSEYALDAYRAHVQGYVLKPVTAAQIREEMDVLFPRTADRLEIRCLGNFDVFWKGEPLIFARTKTRELLAYLVHRQGAACTSDEIITALWEDLGDIAGRKSYLRTLSADLKNTLASIGMEDVIISTHRQMAVRKELLDCDYYRLLSGDPGIHFTGEYMNQYSWAEPTAGSLSFGGSL